MLVHHQDSLWLTFWDHFWLLIRGVITSQKWSQILDSYSYSCSYSHFLLKICHFEMWIWTRIRIKIENIHTFREVPSWSCKLKLNLRSDTKMELGSVESSLHIVLYRWVGDGFHGPWSSPGAIILEKSKKYQNTKFCYKVLVSLALTKRGIGPE